MNKNNAKDYLPLVQALADGKTIQWHDEDKWEDIKEYSFEAPPTSYRIKPEPLEFDLWVSYFEGKIISATTSDMSEFGWQKIRVRQIEE